ncbi:MAG TPA: SIMPL domain-containing protein [Bryobacteraceae bacterium]|jgi:hypothetical protein|nr:SIMPL domain-containing protein [Bryobacteraceae bacterium]
MAEKKRGHAGGSPPARSGTQPQAEPAAQNDRRESQSEDTSGKDTKDMPSHGFKTETQIEGVTVTGEAVRRVLPERAEFLIEVTASAPTVAQALRDNYAKATQVTQAIGALGVQQADVEAISVRVRNLYAPGMQSLPPFAGMPQIAQGGFSPYPSVGGIQPEVQFGSYQASNMLRINVRETARVGEIADAVTRAGANILGPFAFLPADEAAARRSAVEAAGKDARMKAEALATAAGKQIGDPIAVSEDIVATNGTYTALRAALPLAFGAGAPEFTGDLEYYARVSAAFRFQ